MKVNYVGFGVYENENGEWITENNDGNIMNLDTGEIYEKIIRNENGEIVGIE